MNARFMLAGRIRILLPAAFAACALGALTLAAQAGATITPTSNATTVAGGLNGSGLVTAATFATLPPAGPGGETPNAVSTTPLTGFPEASSTNYGILTSGNPLLAPLANTAPNSGLEYDGGTTIRGDSDYDVTVLDLTLNVPAVSNPCLQFDFRFLSEEYPEFVGTEFNDAFIAELDTTNWTTASSDIVAPNNFAKDQLGNPITINATGPQSVSPINSAGTTYDSATQRLRAQKSVTSGTHHLYLSVFDQGDAIFDAALFADNLAVVSNAACGTGSVATAGTAPDTPAVSGSASGNGMTFTFGPPPAGGSFVCQLHLGSASDPVKEEPFEPCTSPHTVSFDQPEFLDASPRLEEGVHTLSVAAVSSSGDADQTPATFEFTPGAGGGGPSAGPPAPPVTPKAKKCKKKKGKKAAAAKKCKKKKRK
jgi:hypothetical protein